MALDLDEALALAREANDRAVRLDYDPSAGALYVYLTDIQPGEVKRTAVLEPGIHLDFDAEERLIGVEILGAKSRLPASLIASALDDPIATAIEALVAEVRDARTQAINEAAAVCRVYETTIENLPHEEVIEGLPEPVNRALRDAMDQAMVETCQHIARDIRALATPPTTRVLVERGDLRHRLDLCDCQPSDETHFGDRKREHVEACIRVDALARGAG